MRAGSAAMIARRSASLMVAQAAISASVRPQPTQVPLASSSRQILMHGVSKTLRPGSWSGIYVGPCGRSALGEKAATSQCRKDARFVAHILSRLAT